MSLNREFIEEPVKRELRGMSESELAALYQYELKETFPAWELKPLYTMEQLQAKGCYEALGLFQGPFLQGYALMWGEKGEEYPLLDYLGVPEMMRGEGLGSEVIGRLRQHCARAKAIVVESEAVESAENEVQRALRRRRLDFYARCGFEQMPFDCGLFGVHYKVLALPLDGERIDPEQVLASYRGRYRTHFSPEIYARHVQLPLKAGEQINPYANWVRE